MLSRQVLDNGKVTSLTKCKHFGFVQRKQNASAMERRQQTNCQRTKKAKSCGLCPMTFKMSRSSAIRPLADRPFVVGPGFSPIPGKLVSQILRGTFVDLSDLWSANLVSSDPEPHLMLDGRLVLTVHPKKQRRQIEDITSWTEAFTVFSLVLMSSFPQCWKDLTLYKLLILRIHRQFRGRMWLAYDKAFRGHAAAMGLFNWSLMNTQLFNFHAAGAPLRSSSPSGEFSEPSGSSSSRIACILWNNSCCTAQFTRCRCYHRSSRCGGSHCTLSCSSRQEQRVDKTCKRCARSPATWGATNWFRH